jgi:chromosome segregation ATPase
MDQELISYLDVHFQAIAGRFQAMEGRFQAIEGRLGAMEGRFDAMEGRFGAMEGRFDAMESRMEERFKAVEESIRHTDIKVEALRGDIRLVAEGVAAVNEKLETFRVELGKLDRRVTRLEQRASLS